jgi:3,4-dihydroxy-2-butanone 4-phosphate synthase
MTATIEQALAALARGEMLVVVDSEDRENEGDLILAAEHATPERLAFMVRHSSGVICAGLPGERLDALHLPPMVAHNSDAMGTAYTVTVDYRHGTSTGISAADRAATLRALVDPQAVPSDFNRPGLMTNNPLKHEGLAEFGLDIVERVPLVTAAHNENAAYLTAKQRLFGHLLEIDGRNPVHGGAGFPCSPAHPTA